MPGLCSCWEKLSRTLTVRCYAGRHQAKGLLHRTSIALSLARGLSQSDRLFPSVQKKNKQTKTKTTKNPTSHGYQYKNKISPAQWGSCAGLETSISIPKPNPTETEKERRKTQIRTRRPEAKNEKSRQAVQEVFQSMLKELCKCQETRRCPGKDVYDFDVACLQETRTCSNRPLVLQSFTVIQRHQGRGMVIVLRSDLSKTVALLNLDRWCTSSRELQGIRIEKTNQQEIRDTNP